MIPRGRDRARLGTRTPRDATPSADRSASARGPWSSPWPATSTRRASTSWSTAAAFLDRRPRRHHGARRRRRGPPDRRAPRVDRPPRRSATRCGCSDARDDVGDLLAAADVFVLPSRREGFPGVVLEAMAVGVPLVLSDIPMAREAAPDERYARYVPVGDAPAFAAAVGDVLDDPEGAATRAAAAQAHFEAHFTIEEVGVAMADLFRRVISPT